VLQILSLLLIEPPSSLRDANSIRDEKVKVLRSLRRFTPEEALRNVVRGQYAEGFINGDAVKGYRAEQGVPAGARLSGGQSFELPVQNSAELQSPAAGRHSVLDDA
jgi:glucose-6-phosphate 1-dehydrogenase